MMRLTSGCLLMFCLIAVPATARPASLGAFSGMPAGDRLQRLDDFRAQLRASDRVRLDRALPRAADGGVRQCRRVDRSRASCEASAYIVALRRTGLTDTFLRSLPDQQVAAPAQ